MHWGGAFLVTLYQIHFLGLNSVGCTLYSALASQWDVTEFGSKWIWTISDAKTNWSLPMNITRNNHLQNGIFVTAWIFWFRKYSILFLCGGRAWRLELYCGQCGCLVIQNKTKQLPLFQVLNEYKYSLMKWPTILIITKNVFDKFKTTWNILFAWLTIVKILTQFFNDFYGAMAQFDG